MQRQAHIPLLLHARPRNVCLVGLGTGITAAGALDYWSVNSIDAVELSPLVVWASRTYFADFNKRIQATPKGFDRPLPARQLDDVASRLGRTLESKAELIASAWCEGERSLATRIAEAVADGFRTIIVAETVIAESLEVDAAKRAVVAMDLDEHGVDVVYTDPLWRSERVAGLVTARALAVAGDLSTAGIVLVGQGQPDERSRAFREYDEHETAFLNHVRMLLLDRGVPEQSVRIAWADWRTPEVPGSVRHLAALGCRRIVVSPSCFPLDSIATLLDLRLSVRQARVDDTVSVVTLPAWHDDPALIEALRSGVVSALAQAETQA